MDATTNTTITTTANIADKIAKVLIGVIPALGPYGAAIDLAFSLVATVAPPLYTEIQGLVERIKNGGAPTAEEITALQNIIANLKNPDSYFNGETASIAPPVVTLPVTAPGVVTTAASQTENHPAVVAAIVPQTEDHTAAGKS